MTKRSRAASDYDHPLTSHRMVAQRVQLAGTMQVLVLSIYGHTKIGLTGDNIFFWSRSESWQRVPTFQSSSEVTGT